MITLAATTITTAATQAGITSVAEGSDMKVVVKNDKLPLPRLEYYMIDDNISPLGRGLVKASRDLEEMVENRKRQKYRRTLKVRVVLAADTESSCEGYFKTFLKKLPKHVNDEDGINVTIKPKRATRQGFSRKLVDATPLKEISVYIDFVGGVYTDESVDLIPDITITPEVQ